MAGEDGHSGGDGSGSVRPGAISALLQELAAAPPPPSEPGDLDGGLRPGAVIGRFELVRELGRGGFGVVWEAKDRELGRRVAFKAVRAGAQRGLREERLLREAEAAAQLSHPNIVTLHDVGRSEHGPYLVLELLEGTTLAARLRGGPLPVREGVRVTVEVAKGLAHAHEHGVVHRDLKPENVFLCADGRVKVLDLGLAHAFGRRRVDGGTPAYMAPEQAEGSPEDERTDVWALGAILFEMLSGRRVSSGERYREPPRLDLPGVPGLGELVARMLEKAPAKRPRDVAAVVAPLTSALGAAEGARSTPAPVRVRRSGLRAPPRFVAAGLVLAALVATAALVLARQLRPRGPRDDGRVLVAVADIVNETGERDLDVVSGLLITSLEQSRRLAVMTQARVLDLAARAGRTDAVRVDETLGREVGRANGVRALLLPAVRRLGTTYSLELRAVDPTRDEHLFTLSERATAKEKLLEILDRLSERAREELREDASVVAGARIRVADAITASLEAYQHYVAGREAWLRDGLRAVALREFLEAVRLDPGFAAAHHGLSSLYRTYGRADLAEPHWRAAGEGLERMPEKEREVARLGRARQRWDKDESHRIAEYLVARFPDDKQVLAQAALAQMLLGPLDGAEAELRQALDLDPGYWYAANLLQLLLGQARSPEMLEVARRAVATRPSAANLNLLAQALLANGAEADAAGAAREALRVDGGGQNSLVVGNACEVLYAAGAGAECVPAWTRLAAEGANELERDYARTGLLVSLAALGQLGEARRVLQSSDLSRWGDVWPLALVFSVGRPRSDAPEALEHARRIPDALQRRDLLAFYGALDEAEHVERTLPRHGPEILEPLYRFHQLAARRAWSEALDQIRLAEEASQNWYLDYPREFAIALLRAEALLAAGRTEEAAAAWPANRLARLYASDHASNYPRLALVRARSMEQLGRRADAIHELDGVIAFWKEADPDLPLLVEAKGMRRRLDPGR